MKRRLAKYTILSICIILILNLIASVYFYHLVIARNVKDFLSGNKDLQVSAKAIDVFFDGDWRQWMNEQQFEAWEMSSFDDLTLQGYFLEAKHPTNKTVLLVHGYLGRGKDMGLYGQYYYDELGYNLLTVDLRGHGQSEGDYIGFGWHDRLDLLGWIDLIVEKRGNDAEIILHGTSMGAAAVLMASGEGLSHHVKAIVADSPYTNVYDLFAYQMKRMYHLPAFPVLPSTSFVAKLRAGYSFNEASACEQVKKATVPILYIHGNEDTFVPAEMAIELYENTKSEAKLWLVNEAKHVEAFAVEKDEYVERLNQFLNDHLD